MEKNNIELQERKHIIQATLISSEAGIKINGTHTT